MEKNMTVSIEQGSCTAVVTINRADGTSTRKTVAIQELKNALNAASSSLPYGSLLGPLPEGYLESRYGSPGNFSVWAALPAGPRTLLYYGKAYHVPFPPLLFYFRIARGNAAGSRLYAFQGKARQGMSLYHYPFGNVYRDGQICWGNLSLPNVTRLKDIEALIGAFFMSDTNDDLYQGIQGIAQRELLHSLGSHFPVSSLMKTGGILSFQD